MTYVPPLQPSRFPDTVHRGHFVGKVQRQKTAPDPQLLLAGHKASATEVRVGGVEGCC